MIEEELVEKFKDYNIFIGNIIRAPKVKKRSKGEQAFSCINYISHEKLASLLIAIFTFSIHLC